MLKHVGANVFLESHFGQACPIIPIILLIAVGLFRQAIKQWRPVSVLQWAKLAIQQLTFLPPTDKMFR